MGYSFAGSGVDTFFPPMKYVARSNYTVRVHGRIAVTVVTAAAMAGPPPDNSIVRVHLEPLGVIVWSEAAGLGLRCERVPLCAPLCAIHHAGVGTLSAVSRSGDLLSHSVETGGGEGDDTPDTWLLKWNRLDTSHRF